MRRWVMLWTILRVQMLEQEKENVRSRKIKHMQELFNFKRMKHMEELSIECAG